MCVKYSQCRPIYFINEKFERYCIIVYADKHVSWLRHIWQCSVVYTLYIITTRHAINYGHQLSMVADLRHVVYSLLRVQNLKMRNHEETINLDLVSAFWTRKSKNTTQIECEKKKLILCRLSALCMSNFRFFRPRMLKTERQRGEKVELFVSLSFRILGTKRRLYDMA